MFNYDYIRLHLDQIRPPERWNRPGSGLAFVFSKSGCGEYVAGANRFRFGPGEILVLNLARGGSLTSQNDRQLTFWYFCVALEHMFPLFAADELCLLPEVVEQFKAGKVYPANSPVARDCHRFLGETSSQFNLGHRSQLLRIVAAVLWDEFKAAQATHLGTRLEERMARVFEALSAEELLHLSVPELAAKFNCSKRHLNRLFHERFGISVASLKMEMRLAKAASLLRDPDVKVTRVAEECGFNHLGLFNTCFKKRFGTSPGKWRHLTNQSRIESNGSESGNYAHPWSKPGLRSPNDECHGSPAAILHLPAGPSLPIPEASRNGRAEAQLAAKKAAARYGVHLQTSPRT
jgi:AraC-like DNA-binding protein